MIGYTLERVVNGDIHDDLTIAPSLALVEAEVASTSCRSGRIESFPVSEIFQPTLVSKLTYSHRAPLSPSL